MIRSETRVGIGTARGKLKRLIRLNEGRHQSDGSHSAREAARDKKRITESLCSALDVTTYQQRRAISAMSQMNLDRFGQQNRSKRLGSVQLASSWIGIEGTIFLGGNDPSDIDFSGVSQQDYPDRFSQQEDFQMLCSQYGVSKRDRYSVSQLVKKELKRIGYFDQENQPIQ